MTIKLQIVTQEGVVKKESIQATNAFLGFKGVYEPGDKIEVQLETENNYLIVQVDGTFSPSLIYVPGKNWCYEVITETESTAFNPNAFKGGRHYVSVRYAYDYEVNNYQNLGLNSHDQKEASGAYPHASANVETRNDTTFFARNAIDGILANDSHGSYPYQSWGINQNPDACLRLDFGRTVVIDQLGVTLRGDYPHDSYWTEGTFTFSDGSELVTTFDKVLNEQLIKLGKKEIQWLEFSKLIKAEDDSPFPALTQLAVYGKNK